MARYGLVNGQIVQYSAEEESAADSEEITIAAEDAAIKYINALRRNTFTRETNLTKGLRLYYELIKKK